jgi:hypothetical protein
LINRYISHNYFDTLEEGIKVFETTSTSCSNFQINDNYFTGIHRMAIETQCGKGNGWLYQGNFVSLFFLFFVFFGGILLIFLILFVDGELQPRLVDYIRNFCSL